MRAPGSDQAAQDEPVDVWGVGTPTFSAPASPTQVLDISGHQLPPRRHSPCDHEWRAHDDHRPDHPDWRPAYLCAEGIERDRAWFERHHGRNHYFRSPIGGEAASLEGGPPGWLPIIVVRQVEPGARIRAACWVQGVH
jgi:hypothetical protein